MDSTVERLEFVADDLAIAYPAMPPGDLLACVRTYLNYAGQLLDLSATLSQHRRLLVTGGWLSLLAATCLIDLHVLETRAWQTLTAGGFRRAAELSRGAEEAAPHFSSVYVQSVAQEGRALARLGERRGTRNALSRLERLASPLPLPDHPEHHYRYDPPKSHAQVTTRLSWIGDTAEGITRQVLFRR